MWSKFKTLLTKEIWYILAWQQWHQFTKKQSMKKSSDDVIQPNNIKSIKCRMKEERKTKLELIINQLQKKK